jgi:hypothetical protein
MRRSTDPRCTVNIKSDVTTPNKGGVAGMQAHPDFDGHVARPRIPRHRALGGCRRGDAR